MCSVYLPDTTFPAGKVEQLQIVTQGLSQTVQQQVVKVGERSWYYKTTDMHGTELPLRDPKSYMSCYKLVVFLKTMLRLMEELEHNRSGCNRTKEHQK